MAEEQAAAQEQPQAQFSMQRIYTKDVSFESPNSPDVFRKPYQPKVTVDLNTKSNGLEEEDTFEVILSITITAKVEEDTAFLIEVQQAGIFLIAGFDPEQRRRVLGTTAPGILFPYAREAIDSLAVKGGFPAIMLAPVNFDALYEQALAQAMQQADQQANGAAEPTA